MKTTWTTHSRRTGRNAKRYPWTQCLTKSCKNQQLRIQIKKTISEFLQDGRIPEIMRTARMCPLPKDKTRYPKLDRIRPLMVFSPLMKCIEDGCYRAWADRIWAQVGGEQLGFRKGAETHMNIIRVLRRRSMLYRQDGQVYTLLIDLAGAYDTVWRQKLYSLLDGLLPDGGVPLYRRLTEELYFSLADVRRKYTLGIPQGAILSPAMFALYLEQALKLLRKANMEFYAYADDVIILATDLLQISEFKNKIAPEWASNWNLFVSEHKTELVLRGRQVVIGKDRERLRRITGEVTLFREVESAKYLGIEIGKLVGARGVKTHLKKVIAEKMKGAEKYRRCVTSEQTRTALSWWLITKVLYQGVAYVALDWVKPSWIEHLTMKSIKNRSTNCRGVGWKFLKSFYGYDLQAMLEASRTRMWKKMLPMQIRLPLNLDYATEVRPHCYYRLVKARVKEVWYALRKRIYDKNTGTFLRCRECNEEWSVTHQCEHFRDGPVLTSEEVEHIHLIRESGEIRPMARLLRTVQLLDKATELARNLRKRATPPPTAPTEASEQRGPTSVINTGRRDYLLDQSFQPSCT
eukprot:TRINITY_DN7850_c0_g1_i1.p2 TRINITY_DN7850_c0_g1~~TRINITY_DN7850_c0_g1_i1.p2  ORF type:complete len:576 (-),score=-17.67 TRINITY_DN7850_c0_g1_i1:8-1735(-)